jgi:tryptophan synthase beta subunit
MKKLLVLVGIGIGFVVGSRAGKAPYARLTRTWREVTGRPEVKQVVDAVADKVEDLTDTVGAKVSSAASSVTE